ncbi:hypothetical protein DFJ74DRAFT_739395, partial [Hyaloraphidium curvatum]
RPPARQRARPPSFAGARPPRGFDRAPARHPPAAGQRSSGCRRRAAARATPRIKRQRQGIAAGHRSQPPRPVSERDSPVKMPRPAMLAAAVAALLLAAPAAAAPSRLVKRATEGCWNLPVSSDGTCGFNGYRCPQGSCCSAWGYCSGGADPGTHDLWCSASHGCQRQFGKCFDNAELRCGHGLGHACSASGPECATGCCVNGACANTHICFPPAGNGASCTASDGQQCQSGCCINGACADAGQCFPNGNPAQAVTLIGASPIHGNYQPASPPPPPPAPAPAPAPQSPAPSGGGGWIEGFGTWYNACDPAQNHGYVCMGSCNGNYIDDSIPAVALNAAQYNHGLCFACIEVYDPSTGVTARFSVQDRCAGCAWGAIDLTPAAWRRLGNDPYTSGYRRMRWRFC